MRRALAPMLFDDHNPQGAQERRASIVAPAQRSPEAERKAARKRTDDGLPAFDKTTRPTPLQQRALDLLGIRL